MSMWKLHDAHFQGARYIKTEHAEVEEVNVKKSCLQSVGTRIP